jgi:hypothetical protein
MKVYIVKMNTNNSHAIVFSTEENARKYIQKFCNSVKGVLCSIHDDSEEDYTELSYDLYYKQGEEKIFVSFNIYSEIVDLYFNEKEE